MERDRNQLRFSDCASRSDYTYHINRDGDIPVLVIVDQDQGGMSVTNNAEAVVREIFAKIGLPPTSMPVIYRDSDGRFDGINFSGPSPFYFLGVADEREAARIASEQWRNRHG